MSRQDLYIFLKEDLLHFGDLPLLSAIKRKYQVDDDSIIRKVIGSLKRTKLLDKNYQLAYEYD